MVSILIFVVSLEGSRPIPAPSVTPLGRLTREGAR